MAELDKVTDALTEVIISDPEYLPSTDEALVTIGATVPTGFEATAADEVKEKLGCACKISKDRGKIYFEITKDRLAEVHRLRSVDNLFVIVQEFTNFYFNESKEAALKDLQVLAAKLPWEKALSTWELNNSLKKKKKHKRPGNGVKEKKPSTQREEEVGISEEPSTTSPLPDPESGETVLKVKPASEEGPTSLSSQADSPKDAPMVSSFQAPLEVQDTDKDPPAPLEVQDTDKDPRAPQEVQATDKDPHAPQEVQATDMDPSTQQEVQAAAGDSRAQSEHKYEAQEEVTSDNSNVLKFRVTCSRAGDNHSFTSNDAARDFGGAVQDHFKWKADMKNFDVEVLLNISFNDLLVGIALTEESLHRRNITHFGPTTLRSTLAYGMLRLCNLKPSDIIIDPMCGTGSIPIEGVSEWPDCYFLAGDNSAQAVKRAASNIYSLLRKKQSPESAALGLPIDSVHWDISRLPLRNESVDVIITDMPFGKRIGSKKKNWDLYPACLREMSRVCRAGTGRAVLLTHDKKCFVKALLKVGHLWKKMHTVWVNIGGLHAGVYLLKRTSSKVQESGREAQEEESGPDVPATPE
ncbi:tRNA (guanine(6)-N(2))-methyltransferase THUMP3 [Discoglossus pictus]